MNRTDNGSSTAYLVYIRLMNMKSISHKSPFDYYINVVRLILLPPNEECCWSKYYYQHHPRIITYSNIYIYTYIFPYHMI